MGKTTETRLGRRMQARDALIGSSPRAIRRCGVQIRPRTTAVSGSTVTFDDGTGLTPSGVIWATGFGLAQHIGTLQDTRPAPIPA